MKKVTSFLIIVILIISILPYSTGLSANENNDEESQSPVISDTDYGTPGVDFKPGEVIVQVKNGAGVLVGKRPAENVEGKTSSVNGNEFTVEEKLDEEDKTSDLVLVKGDDTEELLEAFEDCEDVLYAQPNYKYQLDSLSDGNNDPGVDYQWAIDNKMNYSADDADMHIKQTWDHTQNTEVVVAVCDTGVDYTHPDLVNMMWSKGLYYRTLLNLGGGRYGYNSSGSGNSGNPMDGMGHGTHGAAIIASEYNRKGIAGLTNDVKIMAVKLADANGAVYSSTAYNAYNYIIEAKKAGVNVVAVNNSWSRGNYRTRCQDSLFNEQIASASEAGIASVFSAGNNKTNLDLFGTSNYKNNSTLYAGAIDSTGKKASFSNYGKKKVDVFAPGVNILSATSTSSDNSYMSQKYIPWIQEDNLFYENFAENQGGVFSGTAYYTASTTANLGNGNIINKGFADDSALCFHVSGNNKATTNSYIEFELQIDTNEMTFTGSDKVYFGCAVNSFNNATVYLQNEDGTRIMMNKKTTNYDNGWGIILRDTSTETLQSAIDSSGMLTIIVKIIPRDGIKNDLDIYLDSIGISTKTSEYYYESGTSMAAPMVTGLIALLKSKYPARSTEEIVAMVKGSAKKTEDLSEYCSTGGYVTADAYNNPDSIKPVVNSINNDGEYAVLQGYFYGNEEGTVRIGGFNASVVNWSDRQITVKIPAEITRRSYKTVSVTRTDGLSSSEMFMVGHGELGYDLISAPEGNVKSLNEIDLVANDDLLMSIHTDCFSNKVTFQTYNEQENCWNTIEKPEEICLTIDFDFNITTASSRHKIFVLYEGESSETVMKLATYDTQKKQWTDIVDVSGIADTSSMICVYKNELYILGGKNTSNVYKVYPDTGNTYGYVPNMKQAGGKAKVVANEKYMFVTSYNSNSNQNNIERFDGENWTKGTYKNNAYSFGLDVTTQFPTVNGIDVIGGVRTVNEVDHIVDTFFVDENTLKGTAVSGFTFNETSLTAVDAAITSDYVYIEGMCDELPSIKMGRISLSDNNIGLEPAGFISSDPPTEYQVNVLDIKFQWSFDKSAIRFVSSIDSLDYREIGFIINGTYGERTITNKQRSVTKLFRRIIADGHTFYPTVINTNSKYFYTYTVRDMNPDTDSTWSVTPYAITLDGTKIIGKKGFNNGTTSNR